METLIVKIYNVYLPSCVSFTFLQVPCAPEMMACNNTAVSTYEKGHRSWTYEPVGGTVLLLASYMPFQSTVWANFNQLNLCQLAPYLVATHICR